MKKENRIIENGLGGASMSGRRLFLIAVISVFTLLPTAVNASESIPSKVSENDTNGIYHEILPVSTSVSNDSVYQEVLPTTPVEDEDTASDNQVSEEVSQNEISENMVSDNTISNNAVSENSISENSVSDNAVSENSISDNSLSANSISENSVSDNNVRVLLPIDLNFAIYPDGLSGMGQVFSPDYDMINYSDVPIEMEITDVYYEFADPENCIALSEPYVKGSGNDKKAFYLYLGRADIIEGNTEENLIRYYDEYIEGQDKEWGNQVISEEVRAGEGDVLITDQHLNEPVKFILEPSVYNEEGEFVSVGSESRASFRFFGSMNSTPETAWFNENVELKIVYTYKVVENMEER
jgi:hypothetical protein